MENEGDHALKLGGVRATGCFSVTCTTHTCEKALAACFEYARRQPSALHAMSEYGLFHE